MQLVSKSKFKAQALEFFRQVEQTGQEVVITNRGQPVLRLVPYMKNPDETLKSLRGTVTRYDDPTEPVGLEDWEALR